MAVPTVTSATVEGVKEKVYTLADLPVTVNLNGAATESPTGYEWSIRNNNPDSTNEGGVPEAASGLLSGVHGDFTNGLSTTLASSITLSQPGAYKFSLRAQNGEGWSDPTYYGDRGDCECIVRIKNEYGSERVAPNEFRYENTLNALLDTLEENAIGSSSPIFIPSLWIKPETPHAEDDEFESETLSGWTESFTASASAIDPYAKFASGDPRRVVHTKPYRSWYLIQPPADSTPYFLHKAVTIPTNAFFWFRVSAFDRTAATSNNDASFNFSIWASSGGVPDENERIVLYANEVDGSDFRFQFDIVNGGVPNNITNGSDRHQKGQTFEFFGIQKFGNTFHAWALTNSGQRLYIGSGNYTGGATLDRIGFRFTNTDSSSDPGNAIMGVDFFRMVESSTYFPGYGVLDIPGANYSKPENIPILSYNSASVVDIQSAPGASSVLRAVLNDGLRRTAVSPLTVDLTTSGRGGLDTGSVAANKLYHIYLIPDAAGSGLSAVASLSGVISGGPTGFTAWRYLGFVATDGSTFIYRFQQTGSLFTFTDIEGIAVRAGSAVGPDVSEITTDMSDYFPETGAMAIFRVHMNGRTMSSTEYTLSIRSTTGNDGFKPYANDGDVFSIASPPIPIITQQTLYSILERGSGSSNLDSYSLRLKGIVDGALSSSEAQLQAKSPLTTKGDIYTFDTEETRLSIGSDNQILTADSSVPEGVKWADKYFYSFEDNFDDSSLNAIWTPTAPGSSSVVEGSDGVVLTADGDDDPQIAMSLPAGITNRNWIAQVHLTVSWTGSPGNAGVHFLRINGYGGGVAKFMRFGVRYFLVDGHHLRVSDDGANADSAFSVASAVWLRIRKLGDEVRTDYYEGAATVDVDGEGRWIENDSSKAWYVVPKSGTYEYPVSYTELVLQATQSTDNPGAIAIFRKFKLHVF